MVDFYFTSGIRKGIGERIKKARKTKGLEQVDISAIAGINRSYYGKIEKGLANPSIGKLYKIIKALEVKSSDIFPF
jgi:transcriptional regulator with XRE-family HTH domain